MTVLIIRSKVMYFVAAGLFDHRNGYEKLMLSDRTWLSVSAGYTLRNNLRVSKYFFLFRGYP